MIGLAEPFVAFVGAAASKPPPSRLPTWNEFNTLLLECLCESLAEYSRNRQPTAEILARFRERRDNTEFFAPDFQAQLMEEEIGPDYFRVWQSLDTEAFGPAHAGLAELASQGRLAAIITTNFDRLIEAALQARGQAFKVFHDRVTFEDLPAVSAGERASALPIIKIHGSIEDATSLIDTLRQRLAGRPDALLKALRILLERYAWLYLGFSGADFGYNENYLGIKDCADQAKGFVFLARQGREVREGVRKLAEAFGPDKASIVYGDVSTWLSSTFGLSAPGLAPIAASTEDDTVARVKGRIRQWVDGLGPMATVNILCSLLKSTGMETHAAWLLRKTWKSYRSPEDTQGKSYQRYNYNYGLSLLEAGSFSNPVQRADDMSNFAEWKKYADENAVEYLLRSYDGGNLITPAGAYLASAYAYRGEVGRAMELTERVADEALARKAPLDLCDVAIASAAVYDIVQTFKRPIAQFRLRLQDASAAGDEPRRAMLCALLGRFLTYAGQFDEADKFIGEAERVAGRLGLKSVLLASEAAKGLWLAESGASAANSLDTLQQLVDVIHRLDEEPLFTNVDISQPENPAVRVKKQRRPLLCRVLLDLNRTALRLADGATLNRTVDELAELVSDVFPGYYPHYCLAYAESLLRYANDKRRELAAELIQSARQIGAQSENPWVPQQADALERHFELSGS